MTYDLAQEIINSQRIRLTLWTLYRSYFKGISADIELLMYNMTCCVDRTTAFMSFGTEELSILSFLYGCSKSHS
jgi:hypothetical protein